MNAKRQADMRHTYLFEEGTWRIEGEYISADGGAAPLAGKSRIIHAPDAWDVSGQMTIRLAQDATFENHYTFQPMTPDQLEAQWSSINPSLGRLEGHLAVVGDSLLLRWHTAQGDSFGMEYLQWIEAGHYIDRGAMFSGGMRISSWSVDLRRIEPD